jgi:hypothetical protein
LESSDPQRGEKASPLEVDKIRPRMSDFVDEDGVWVDSDQIDPTLPQIAGRGERQDEHIRQMQRNVLIGIGSLITLTLLSIIIAVSGKWMTEVFAKEILQQVLAPLLAAAAVVVGYFFGQRS